MLPTKARARGATVVGRPEHAPPRRAYRTSLEDAIAVALRQVALRTRLYVDDVTVDAFARALAPMIVQLPYARRITAEKRRRQRVAVDQSGPLSPRQKRALVGVALGLSTHEIGEDTQTTSNTIKTQLKGVYAALGARNAANAVAIAFRTGVLTPQDLTMYQEDTCALSAE